MTAKIENVCNFKCRVGIAYKHSDGSFKYDNVIYLDAKETKYVTVPFKQGTYYEINYIGDGWKD